MTTNPRHRIFVAGLWALAATANVSVCARAGDFESPGTRGAVDRQLAPYGLPGWHPLPAARVNGETLVEEARRKKREAQLLEKLNWKLDTIVIPVVDFREMALRDAMDWLQAAMERHDTTDDEPGQRGIILLKRFRTPGGNAFNPKISLQARDATAREAVQGLADTLGLKVEISPYAVGLATP